MQRAIVFCGFMSAAGCAWLTYSATADATRFLPLAAMCAIALFLFVAGRWERCQAKGLAGDGRSSNSSVPKEKEHDWAFDSVVGRSHRHVGRAASSSIH